jgi:hypothetical protein
MFFFLSLSVCLGRIVRINTTARNHEKKHGIALHLAEIDNDDDNAAPDNDDDNMLDSDDDDGLFPLPRPIGPSANTLVARETLGLISSHRVTQTGAVCINAVYAKHFGPEVPDHMQFGSLFCVLLVFHAFKTTYCMQFSFSSFSVSPSIGHLCTS